MRKLFTLLLVVLTSTATLFAWDYEHVQIGDLYYNLDATNNTAEVTYENSLYTIGEQNYINLTVVNIPDSIEYNSTQYAVTNIGQSAFYGSSNITQIHLPYTIKEISPMALIIPFQGSMGLMENGKCSLTMIDVDPNNSYFSSIDGILYNKAGTKLITFPGGRGGEYTSSEGIKEIGIGAFAGNMGLKKVSIPESVTSIGSAAFAYCLNLREVNLPSSITEISELAFVACYLLQDIEIPSGIKKIGAEAFEACLSILSIDIPQGVDTIGRYAFPAIPHINYAGSATGAPWGASYMNKYVEDGIVYADQSKREILAAARNRNTIVIPASVDTIGYQAICMNDYKSFMGSLGELLDLDGIAFGASMVICHATNVPNVGREFIIHSGESINGTLYVPAESIELYKAADGWKEFKNIVPIQASEADVTEVQITPSVTTVDIAWPQVSGAASYELVIKDKDGNVICTLTFNAQGQLTALAFNAPARNNAPQQKQAAGFQFTITGLEEGTAYDYTIVSKDENGTPLDTQNGSFTTADTPTAIDNTPFPSGEGRGEATKILHNGQIYILRGDKTYTLTGVELK